MTFLRSLLGDLVEKRLWPVAVALLVALVALPVVLLHGGSSGNPAPAPAATAPAPDAAAAAAGKALVSVDTTPAARLDRSGKVRDPFRPVRPAKRATAAPTTGTGAAIVAPVTGGGAMPSGPTGTPSSSSTSTPSLPSAPSAPAGAKPSTPVPAIAPAPHARAPKTDLTRTVQQVNVRFGTPDDQATLHDLTRLRPLPSASVPVLMFLGVLSDQQTAVFLVSGAQGLHADGRCAPRGPRCRVIEVRAGDRATLKLSVAGKQRRFQLDVQRVKHHAASAQSAARAHSRMSSAGLALLLTPAASRIAALAGYTYLRDRGVLVRNKAGASTARSAAARGVLGAGGR